MSAALYHTATLLYASRLLQKLDMVVAGYDTCMVEKYYWNRFKFKVMITEIVNNT